MNRGLDCMDTIYELTFPRDHKEKLHRLAKIMNQKLAEDFHCQVVDNGGEGHVSFVVTHYQELP